jgi:hypothetical protein
MAKIRVCDSCGKADSKVSAQFALLVNGKEAQAKTGGKARFHKHCANLIAQHTPEGVTAEVVHWSVLANKAREAEELAEQNRVRDFWETRFSAARKAAALNGAKAVPASDHA